MFHTNRHFTAFNRSHDHLIRTCAAEGRSRAKVAGKHIGRPPALTRQHQKAARQRCVEGATLEEFVLKP